MCEQCRALEFSSTLWVVVLVVLPAAKGMLSAQESCAMGAHRSQSEVNTAILTFKADKGLQGRGSK